MLCRPATQEAEETERRSSLRVKTERKLYCPGNGVDGRWEDNPTSPSEEANHDHSHHAPVANIAFAVVKPGYARNEMITNEDTTTKNQQDDYGMYVDNLEYGSDETRSLTLDEKEIFNYEIFNETVEEDDHDDDGTVEENKGVF